jgi:cell division septum initiation protein DivIVA
MDIHGRLEQIEEIIQDAKSMPLSSSVLVNREEVLELLQAAGDELPDEVKQARWMVRDRDELLAKARREADSIVERARREAETILERAQQERDRLVGEQEIVHGAQREAQGMLDDAGEQARRMRLEAEDYVDARLAQFEVTLDKTSAELERAIAQVRRGRERLRGTPQPESEGDLGAAELEEEEVSPQ